MEDGPGTGPPTASPGRGASNSPEFSNSVHCSWKEKPHYRDMKQSLVQVRIFLQKQKTVPNPSHGDTQELRLQPSGTDSGLRTGAEYQSPFLTSKSKFINTSLTPDA